MMVPTYWSAKHVMLPRVKKSQVSTPSCPDWSAQTERNMRSTETPGSPHTSAARRQLEGAVVLFVKGQHGRPNKLSHGHKQCHSRSKCVEGVKEKVFTLGHHVPQHLTPIPLCKIPSTPRWCTFAILCALSSFQHKWANPV